MREKAIPQKIVGGRGLSAAKGCGKKHFHVFSLKKTRFQLNDGTIVPGSDHGVVSIKAKLLLFIHQQVFFVETLALSARRPGPAV